MEEKFKSVSIYDLYERFPSRESCLAYLAKKKWESGFACKHCGHKNYCSGGKPHIRQCTRCRYKESATANTLFHKVKFDLVKAFAIVYFIATNKKGISSCELSRTLQLRQKTCWLFRLKVLSAMESHGNVGLSGKVEISDFEIGMKKAVKNGQEVRYKKRVVLAVEKKGKGVSHVYAGSVDGRGSKQFQGFVGRAVNRDALISCYKWRGYDHICNHYQVVARIKKTKKTIMPLSNRIENSIISWLRGIHHHAELLQYYLDEFCYRFNRNQMKEEIFDHLLLRMVHHRPRTYLDIIR
ncbi:IS1595 family transposase [Membranihabitans marinus]|uniref:IS1595 family transposase n=1 Tax=Membranihabitans marinus TaxID=1227546 RepID=UPI001F02075D|nr:IS1595 family transposase [Membranihabitans marinus]